MIDRFKTRIKRLLRQRLLSGRFRPTHSWGTPSPDRIPVLLCLWNRPERIDAVIELLDAQRSTPGVDLYLWNNARADHDRYAQSIERAERTGALGSVQLFRSPYNLGSIARFYLARRLALRGYRGPVIVIDDDQTLPEDFIREALRQYDPAAITAWWAFRIAGSYWEREFAVVGGKVDHIGPGGMICSAEVFLDRSFFEALPERYWLLDDIWLSHWAKAHGLRLAKLDVGIEFVEDDVNQYPTVADLKVEFYDFLRAQPG